MLKFFELRKELIKKYNSEEHNIVYEDDLMKRITSLEKLDIKEMDEKEIDFSKDLDYKTNEIIVNNNYRNKLSNKNDMSVYERINLKTNELNLIMSYSLYKNLILF